MSFVTETRLGAVLIGLTGWVPGREFRVGADAETERTEVGLVRISAAQDRFAERFRSVAGATIHPVEWRTAYNFPSEVIAREARTADLVVIGGHPVPDDPRPSATTNRPLPPSDDTVSHLALYFKLGERSRTGFRSDHNGSKQCRLGALSPPIHANSVQINWRCLYNA